MLDFTRLKTTGAQIVLLALIVALPAVGAQITVMNTDDSGPGSLRQAILDANSGDEILFHPSVTGTINLTSGHLLIQKDLTITGPGATVLAVSGGNLSRVFRVEKPGLTSVTVGISGLTIRNGFPTGGGLGDTFGGGIFVHGAVLTVTGCTVTGNRAEIGGGIEVGTATLILIDSVVSENVATRFGGGIRVQGSASLTNSIVAGNRAGIQGGGMDNTGTLTVTDSTVDGNSANQGGGIFSFFDGARLTVTNSTVSNNTAVEDGGGIANRSSPRATPNSISDSTISGNSGGRGGGIYNFGSLTVTNSTVSGNWTTDPTTGDGGGILNVRSLTLTNSTVASNSALNAAGGIANVNMGSLIGTLTLVHATIVDNTCESCVGGIYNAGAASVKSTLLAHSGSNCGGTETAISTSLDHNLSTDDSCTFFIATGDQNNAAAGLDPAGLQPNGGLTETIALLAGSPAIDAIPDEDCTDHLGVPILTDQRNVTRPQGPGCDIGAYELALNVPPVITSIAGSLEAQAVGSMVNITASFTDGDSPDDSHTCTINWGDGSPDSVGQVVEPTVSDEGACSESHMYSAAGVYTVSVTVTDAAGESDTEVFQYVVIYDPSAGFITGGGWINSPLGAYKADASLTGKASFGFVSKYQKGASVPTGQTEFQFKAGSLNFHSSVYDWLVVAGAKAQYKGMGTVNGDGNYGFLLTAIDGQINGGGGADKFRIKIWDKDNNDAIVYDNQTGADDDADPSTTLGGGSIVIHAK